jgi:hypothetical protein
MKTVKYTTKTPNNVQNSAQFMNYILKDKIEFFEGIPTTNSTFLIQILHILSRAKLMQKLLFEIYTFPNTGAIPIITEARAERTCCEESDDNSCKSCSI